MVKRVLKEVDLVAEDKKPYAIKTVPAKIKKPPTEKQLAAIEKRKAKKIKVVEEAKVVEKVTLPGGAEVKFHETVKEIKVKKPPTEKQLAAREKLKLARLARLAAAKEEKEEKEKEKEKEKPVEPVVEVVEPLVVEEVKVSHEVVKESPSTLLQAARLATINEGYEEEEEGARPRVINTRYYNYPIGKNRPVMPRFR